MKRSPKNKTDDLIAFWDREPIGYDIKPRGLGWAATMVRDRDDELGGLGETIASGTSERRVQRQAARAVVQEHRRWAHERSQPTKRFILVEVTR